MLEIFSIQRKQIEKYSKKEIFIMHFIIIFEQYLNDLHLYGESHEYRQGRQGNQPKTSEEDHDYDLQLFYIFYCK